MASEPKSNNGKTTKLAAIAAVLALFGLNAGSFYKVQSDSEWQGRNLESLSLRNAKEHDVMDVRFTSLKTALDVLATQGASREAKIDLLLQMVRDVKAEVKR